MARSSEPIWTATPFRIVYEIERLVPLEVCRSTEPDQSDPQWHSGYFPLD